LTQGWAARRPRGTGSRGTQFAIGRSAEIKPLSGFGCGLFCRDRGEARMSAGDARSWMWADAVDMLARAERLHRQLFNPRSASRHPAWEPPVDVIETDDEVVVLAALPGVQPSEVKAHIADGMLHLAGLRRLPAELATATIHRMELPQGLFERHIPVPAGRYGGVRSTMVDGCLVVRLQKAG
jgi:HSP20 family protein